MSQPIESYALLGNMCTAALVGRDGSVDWLCAPRFDSGSCFAALLGEPEHGRWLIAPSAPAARVTRRYRPGTLVLETSFETEDGAVTVIDFMPLTEDDRAVDLVRIVRGDRGAVEMRTELIVRFDYGHTVPWVRRQPCGLAAVAGPDALDLSTPVELHGVGFTSVAAFTVREGETVPFTLSYRPSTRPPRPAPDAQARLAETEKWWAGWSGRCPSHSARDDRWHEAVVRSLITLKALSYAPTGGIVAAPTTSLPEHIGGVRNWDYRYCWIRDATFTLYALLISGYRDEARDWRQWLLRPAAGKPDELQIMYGLGGERRLPEMELSWLPGYEGSQPVRTGNAAAGQLQLDVYGEMIGALYAARRFELEGDGESWRLEKAVLRTLCRIWREPDAGIWEVRGSLRQFTHSRLMAWVAMNSAVRTVEEFGLPGPVDEWRSIRDEIHADICANGFSTAKNSFVQYYGGTTLDAALLMMPQLGFLPPEDPRIIGTVAAIERELVIDGLVQRYSTEAGTDGLPPGEGVFLACSFWLADAYAMLGRQDEAERLFERLLDLRNDVGLLAEEYDPAAGRQLGNFPQAFSHVALINTASNLSTRRGAAAQRAGQASPAEAPG